jgi:hypothetical protein
MLNLRGVAPPPIGMLMNPGLFRLPQAEIRDYGEETLTYGTLTMRGIDHLSDRIKTYQTNIYGLDLGCGDGELIYHLEARDDSRWDGVEISEHRVSMQSRDVNIWQGDMLEEDFRPYSVLHADNLCLSEAVADKLEEKIIREFQGLYITYRSPQSMRFIRAAQRLETALIETTWGPHPIHFYWVGAPWDRPPGFGGGAASLR